MNTPRNQAEWVAQRNAEILNKRKAGQSAIDIAHEFGISVQRVYQVLEEQGFKKQLAEFHK